MTSEKKLAVLLESIFWGMLITGVLGQAASLWARHESRVFALEYTILFECHEAYAFGTPSTKEAVARIVRACADYIDEDDIVDNPALVIFMNDIAKRKRGG